MDENFIQLQKMAKDSISSAMNSYKTWSKTQHNQIQLVQNLGPLATKYIERTSFMGDLSLTDDENSAVIVMSNCFFIFVFRI